MPPFNVSQKRISDVFIALRHAAKTDEVKKRASNGRQENI